MRMNGDEAITETDKKQKSEISRQKLKPDSWYVERDDGRLMVVVSKEKGQVRKLRWGA